MHLPILRLLLLVAVVAFPRSGLDFLWWHMWQFTCVRYNTKVIVLSVQVLSTSRSLQSSKLWLFGPDQNLEHIIINVKRLG